MKLWLFGSLMAAIGAWEFFMIVSQYGYGEGWRAGIVACETRRKVSLNGPYFTAQECANECRDAFVRLWWGDGGKPEEKTQIDNRVWEWTQYGPDGGINGRWKIFNE